MPAESSAIGVLPDFIPVFFIPPSPVISNTKSLGFEVSVLSSLIIFFGTTLESSVSINRPLKGPVEYVYLVDRLYKDRDPAGDVAISLFDPGLNIDWPLKKEEMIISDRDKQAVSLKERFSKVK